MARDLCLGLNLDSLVARDLCLNLYILVARDLCLNLCNVQPGRQGLVPGPDLELTDSQGLVPELVQPGRQGLVPELGQPGGQ